MRASQKRSLYEIGGWPRRRHCYVGGPENNATRDWFLAMRWLAVILLLWATISRAQLAIQGPKPTYNGQTVSAVDLIANPHRDVGPLRSLVLQKAGKPYSQDKVEKSIAALVGQFPKVQVSIIPEITGLRLNFLLEPAYYIGFVNFPGAEKFSYTRLLQAVDLADQEPFDQERLPLDQQSLEKFLQHEGYFQAAVSPTYEIDDPHQIVNVKFMVKLGPQARIGTVTFQGLDATEDSRLTRSVHSLRARFTGGLLKRSKPYTSERIKSATSLIRRTLAKQHRLASKVEELAPSYHQETNRVDVTFKTEIGPLVIVRTTGARLTWVPYLAGREMKKEIPIYSEGTIDRDLVEEGRQNLIDYFQKKGYFEAKVATNLQRQADKFVLVYAIDKGKKHKVQSISFVGNNSISAKELVAQVTVKKAHLFWHGSVSQKLLTQSEKNIEALYRDRGFEEVKVDSQAVDHHLKVDVIFHITEERQTLVANITVTGNGHLSQKELVAPAGFELQPGKPFSPRRLVNDRNRISANYLNRGFLDVEVKATVDRDQNDPHRLNVLYTIDEHQLVDVAQTVYLGQQHTRLSLIRKATKLPVESPMKRAELLEAESNLYDLNIFDWASVGPRKAISDQTDEDVLVKVHEARRTDIAYGFGFEVSHRGGSIPTGTVGVPGLPPIQLGKYQIAPSQSTFASPQGSVEINRRNMRGLGETASASLLLSRLDQRVITTYAQPHLVGAQWSSLTSVSIERNTENPLFAASLGDISFQVERVISHRTNTRLQFRYDFNKTYLSHLLVPALVLPQDLNVHLSTFSSTLIHDTRDKPLDAHHGNFGTLNVGITPTALGSSANFAKLFGQYAYYRPFHSIVFANSIRLGLAKAFADSFVPTSQLFFSGGGTSLRGFPIDEAGPQRLVPFCGVLSGQSGCVKINVPVGGNQLFILNSEIRFPLKIMKALGGVIYYDGGNVYSAINLNNFVNNYTNTIGVGLRYSTPIGPVRFDIGKNLNPVSGIGSVQYYITLGQAF
jgi:outer membrane protein insertion porin family